MTYSEGTLKCLSNYLAKVENSYFDHRNSILKTFNNSMTDQCGPNQFIPKLMFLDSKESKIKYFVIRIEQNLRIQLDFATMEFSYQYEKKMDINEFYLFSKRIGEAKFDFDIPELEKQFRKINRIIVKINEVKWMYDHVKNIVDLFDSINTQEFEKAIMYADIEKIQSSNLIGSKDGKTAVVVWYRKFLYESFPNMCKKHRLFSSDIEFLFEKKKRKNSLQKS